VHPPKRTIVSICIFAGCVAFFAVTNLLQNLAMGFRPGFDLAAIVFVTACIRAIGAQAGLLAIWSVLAPAPWSRRLLVGVSSTLVVYGAWVIGYSLHASSASQRAYFADRLWIDVVATFLCLPLLLIAVQIPLWAMRLWCRWRIMHQADCEQAAFIPTRIRDLMIATGVVAAALNRGFNVRPK